MKLAGLGKFINQNIGATTRGVLPGTALNAAFGAMSAGPQGGLIFGLSDLATSVPASLLGRYAGRNIKSKGTRDLIEGGANLGGVLLGNELGRAVLMAGQPQQIAQQIEQRSVVNQLPLEEQLLERSPGTNFQTVGLSPRAEFEQLLNRIPAGGISPYLSQEDQMIIQQLTGGR